MKSQKEGGVMIYKITSKYIDVDFSLSHDRQKKDKHCFFITASILSLHVRSIRCVVVGLTL